jgi:uncharacterized protein YjcR
MHSPMKNLQIEIEPDEELDARKIMAAEWNQFQVPKEIDELITKLMYWEEKQEDKVVLVIMEEFFAQECFARKCIWFSSANYHYRKQEEENGAFYQSAFCSENCVPRKFRNFIGK